MLERIASLALLVPMTGPYLVTGVMHDPRPQYTYANKKKEHEGVDLAPRPFGATAYARAALPGTVLAVDNQPTGYGLHVVIEHDWNGVHMATWYAHLAASSVRAGERVNVGHALGVVGASGLASGPHLHFSLQLVGHGLRDMVLADVINPIAYFCDNRGRMIDPATWVVGAVHDAA